MKLDPQAQAIADQLALLPALDLDQLSAADYRAAMGAMLAAPPELDPQVETSALSLACPEVTLPARSYRPPADGSEHDRPLPLIVYFHGGGFASGGLDTHDNICRRLAASVRTLVVAVDYRLAPEHPFPAPVDDAVAAIGVLHQRAAELGADPARIAVAGDSAGANLATVAARVLRDAGPQAPRIVHQLLFYPVTDAACDTASYRDLAEAPILTSALMQWFWRQYLARPEDGNDERASPLRSKDLGKLPAATVITAGFDPLRDEGEAYGLALAAAGNSVTLRRWPGQFHGFASLLGSMDAADEALAFGACQLRQAFLCKP